MTSDAQTTGESARNPQSSQYKGHVITSLWTQVPQKHEQEAARFVGAYAILGPDQIVRRTIDVADIFDTGQHAGAYAVTTAERQIDAWGATRGRDSLA